MVKTESKRRSFSPEFKRDAVQPLAAVARTLGITPSMLGRWKNDTGVRALFWNPFSQYSHVA